MKRMIAIEIAKDIKKCYKDEYVIRQNLKLMIQFTQF